MAKNSRPNWLAHNARALAKNKLIPLSALTLAGVILAYPLLVRANPADLERRGEQNIAKGDYLAAYTTLRQAISLNPLSFSAHLGLSRVYEATRNYDLAARELNLAERVKPDLDLSQDINRLKSLSFEGARLQEEIAGLEKLVTAYPSFRDGWVRLAYDYYRVKNDQEMKKALDRAYELDPNYEPTLRLRALLPLP